MLSIFLQVVGAWALLALGLCAAWVAVPHVFERMADRWRTWRADRRAARNVRHAVRRYLRDERRAREWTR